MFALGSSLRSKMVVFGGALVAYLTLCGCHADITYRVDVHSDRSATVTLKSTMDDQFYQLATSQGRNPFDPPSDSGWQEQRSVDPDGSHVVLLTRTVAPDDVTSLQMPSFGNGAAASDTGAREAKPLGSLHTEVGLFSDRTSLETQVPPLMAKTADDARNPYASAGSALAGSIISIHFVLSTPGKVVDTNGETLPDGGTSWNLSLASPTTMRYDVETPDVVHIVLAIAVALGVLMVVIVILRHRSRSPIPPGSSVNAGG